MYILLRHFDIRVNNACEQTPAEKAGEESLQVQLLPGLLFLNPIEPVVPMARCTIRLLRLPGMACSERITYPDPREDPKSRSRNGGSYKVP